MSCEISFFSDFNFFIFPSQCFWFKKKNAGIYHVDKNKGLQLNKNVFYISLCGNKNIYIFWNFDVFIADSINTFFSCDTF